MPIVTCLNCGAKNRVDDRAQTLQPVCGRCGGPLSISPGTSDSLSPIALTDETFARIAQVPDGPPVLVDCWAAWCGPCRMIAPVMDQLAAESNGRYIIAKLNVDENPRVAREYQVDSIPTMLLFKGGRLIDRIVGLQPKQTLAARLAQAV